MLEKTKSDVTLDIIENLIHYGSGILVIKRLNEITDVLYDRLSHVCWPGACREVSLPKVACSW